MRRTSALLLALLIPMTLLVATAAPAVGGPKLEPGLIQKLKSGELDGFVVEFNAKADLSQARATRDRSIRGHRVVDALVDTAQRSQAAARVAVARGGGSARSYFLRNVMVVEGSAALATALAARSEVEAVRAERTYPLIAPVSTAAAVEAAEGAPEWGVSKIGADVAWDANIFGGGVVVANIDTGVEYEHPALVAQYRGTDGTTFDHAYSWWDPTGICGDAPCDNAGHGTHVMGTMVGGDGPGPFTPDIGVAPGARWIAAKGCEDFFCTEESLLSSGQFILAPTDLNGNNPDPDKRPDIVNNSWGSGPGDSFYLETVEAWRAAGIIPVFASGNPGSDCGQGGSPGDYLASLSAGATDINDVIADFSGRGPSPFGKVNPDISAPGVDVNSSVPGGGYAEFSGTSMAAPHTSGALALILSAEAGLLGQVDATIDALSSTALDILDDSCGGDEDGDPNNVYGDGRIDAGAAVALVATGGTLAGIVENVVTDAPVAGATVTASAGGREYTAVTDDTGAYDLFLAAGSYTVTAEAFGYQGGLYSGVPIVTDQTTTRDFFLGPLPRKLVTGTVTAAEDGTPIAGAHVLALGTPVPAAVTNSDGDYSLELPIGSYTLRASAGGCAGFDEEAITLTNASDLERDFAIARKIDGAGYGCGPVAFEWEDAAFPTALFGDDVNGRLVLPFTFEFYGEDYTTVYISDNGYLTFDGPPPSNADPLGIPSADTPNAAIYFLWQDLRLDSQSQVSTEAIASPLHYVIEVQDALPRGTSSRIDVEVKLWPDGSIDVLYGDNAANPGDGRAALVGIENLDGTQGLQFSMFESVLQPNSAYRFEQVPNGVVSGTVTDANDGEPVAGATVTAEPGGWTARTDATGAYSLRLRPGSYTLTASGNGYTTSAGVAEALTDGEAATIDFALTAPVLAVAPASMDVSTNYGQTTSDELTISNTGSATMTWELLEGDQGVVLPELPPAIQRVRTAQWGPAATRAQTLAETYALPPDALGVVIDDPDDDASGPVELTRIRGGSDDSEMSLALEFADGSPVDSLGGFVHLDTDQDPSTGYPPEFLNGLPENDIGFDYFLDLFGVGTDDPFVGVYTADFNFIADVPARVTGQQVAFEVPLSAFGDDDGAMDMSIVVGDWNAPYDWAPNEGHGVLEPFVDAPWMAPAVTSGTVDPGASTEVEVDFAPAGTGPGVYSGKLVVVTGAPKDGAVVVPVELEVVRPAAFGRITGRVSQAHTGARLEGAVVTLKAQWNSDPLNVRAITDQRGRYSILGPEGEWVTKFTAPGHVTRRSTATVVRGATVSAINATLHAKQPHAVIDAPPVRITLRRGAVAHRTVTLSNPGGHAPLTFRVGEVDSGAGGGGGEPPLPEPRALPASADSNARTTRELFGADAAPTPAADLQEQGEVITSWPTGLGVPWGVGVTDDVWIGDPEQGIDVRFTPGGEELGRYDTDWAAEWAADMAYDSSRGLIWQLNVGGDNGIYGWDPATGAVVDSLTGAPWSDISQRGLAYDPLTDSFYVGGWNEGVIYHVAGPSAETPGATLGQCTPDDPNISGLAWNPAFGMLWAATNSEYDTIWLIDPDTCAPALTLSHPDPGFNGAGLEMDTIGNLWMVSQAAGDAYLLESGVPNFSDVPWLTVTPDEGSVAVDESATLDIAIDTTGMSPGRYEAQVVVQTNDPHNPVAVVPVSLLVPAYQRAVNAGGPAHTTGAGQVFGTARAFEPGAWGYVGGTRIATGAAIAGTSEDPLYQDAHVGMSAFRFTVPDGRYRVNLKFADIVSTESFERVFDVQLEGAVVASKLDIYDEVGALRAYNRSFTVDVVDGRLDVGFVPRLGRPALVSALTVTWIGAVAAG